MVKDKLYVSSETELIPSFSINVGEYEKKMKRFPGMGLNTFFKRIGLKMYRGLNGANVKYGNHNVPLINDILDKLEDSPGFSSIKIKSLDEVFMHINNIYSLMYEHYFLGKINSRSFPSSQCCPSSQNLVLASILKGYMNASVIDCNKEDHCYVAYPFLLNNKKYLIIADPTSDQLWNSKNIISPRNHIFVVENGNWEYKTNWKSGVNLYPTRFSNLDTLRKNRYQFMQGIYDGDINRFFKESYENSFEWKEFTF